MDHPAAAIAIIVIVGAAVRIMVSLGSDAILWADSDVFLETVRRHPVIAYLTFLPAFAQSPQDRYRLPIDGLRFTFAAAGVAAVWSRSFRRDQPDRRDPAS